MVIGAHGPAKQLVSSMFLLKPSKEIIPNLRYTSTSVASRSPVCYCASENSLFFDPPPPEKKNAFLQLITVSPRAPFHLKKHRVCGTRKSDSGLSASRTPPCLRRLFTTQDPPCRFRHTLTLLEDGVPGELPQPGTRSSRVVTAQHEDGSRGPHHRGSLWPDLLLQHVPPPRVKLRDPAPTMQRCGGGGFQNRREHHLDPDDSLLRIQGHPPLRPARSGHVRRPA